MIQLFRALIATLVIMMGSTAFAADVYKWKDDAGQTQYTQSPPVGGRPYEVIKDRKKAMEAEAAAAAAANSANTASTAKVPKANPEKPGTEEKSLSDRNCEAAKQNRKVLSEFTRVRVTDAKGDQRFLTEDERQDKLKQADKDIAYFCSGGAEAEAKAKK